MHTKVAEDQTATTKTTNATSKMSESFVSDASKVFAVVTIILTAFVALTGAAAWWFANRESNMKDDQLKRYQKEADERIAMSKAKSDEAISKAAEANERASKADERRAALELELRQFTAPRTISPDKSNAFILATKDLPKGPVRCGVNFPDRETQRFATEVVRLLTGAGYTVPSMINYGIAVPYSEDVWMAIRVADRITVPPHARPLQNALSDINLGTIAYGPDLEGFKVGVDEVLLLIGPKW